jgi:hypothetical protein
LSFSARCSAMAPTCRVERPEAMTMESAMLVLP